MYVKSETYLGNGADNRVIPVGFQPDLVIIKPLNNGVTNAYFRTADMTGDNTGNIRGDFALEANMIQSLTSSGFEIGTNVVVNESGTTYTYLAVADNGDNDFCTFTFTGNATDGLAVTGFGFQPDYVCIKSNSAITGAATYSTEVTTRGFVHFAGANRSDLYASLDADGVTVNNGSGSGANLINVNAVAHYGFAFKIVADQCSVFSYTGNGSDNRDITTPNFSPAFVWIKGTGAVTPALRTSSMSGDASIDFDSSGTTANKIQSFISTGFQVGTNGSVNTNTSVYHVLALKENVPTSNNRSLLLGIG